MVNGKITMSGTGQELLEREEVQTAYLDGGGKKAQANGGRS
jgi:branched-chain amino acid transport system ATP-binding protein